MNAIKTQVIELPQTYSDFRTYLEQSLRNPFAIDLSNADLMTVVNAYIKVKEKANPDCRRGHSSLIKSIKLIEKAYNVTLAPGQITDIFWTYFVSMLQERGLKASTINTQTCQLKTILRWGQRYNVKLSPSYDIVKAPRPRSIHIALSADDVSRIYHFDVDLFYRDRRPQFRDRMKRVRDQFVLGCNLGQRFSDMCRIDATCFDRNMFRIVQKKTGNQAVLNIDELAIDAKTTYEILQRYNYEAPYKAKINTFDASLKELMRDIGFTEVIKVEEKIKGEMVSCTKQKWELIASHTCRRTFASNAAKREISLVTIKRATGHSNLETLDNYIKEL